MGKSLITIIAEVGKPIANIPTAAVSFLARQYQATEVIVKKAQRKDGYTLEDLSYAAFEKLIGKEETSIMPYDGPSVNDMQQLDMDGWVILDGCFPEVLYAGAPERAEEKVLHQIVTSYERSNLQRESGREWVAINPAETREILRKARQLYEMQKIADMNPEQKERWSKRNEKAMFKRYGVGQQVYDPKDEVGKEMLEWCKELDAYFTADANK